MLSPYCLCNKTPLTGKMVFTVTATSTDNTLTVPNLHKGDVVSWGDGTTNTATTEASPSHTYTAGTYTGYVEYASVRTGDKYSFSANKIVTGIVSLPTLPMRTGMTFQDNTALVAMPKTLPRYITNLGALFERTPFNGDLSGWDTGNVTNLAAAFAGGSFNNASIANWDVSKVTNFGYTFSTSTFNHQLNWDVSAGIAFSGMFAGNRVIAYDLGGKNFPVATNMKYMYVDATAMAVDMTGWCVPLITSYPEAFISGSSPTYTNSLLPVWGTCPS